MTEGERKEKGNWKREKEENEREIRKGENMKKTEKKRKHEKGEAKTENRKMEKKRRKQNKGDISDKG